MVVTVEFSKIGTTFTDITPYFISGSWSKTTNITQNKFTLKLDPAVIDDVMTDIKAGYQIKFKDAGTQVFRGLITNFRLIRNNDYTLSISGVDASIDLFGGVRSFHYTNKTASEIIILLAELYQGKRNKITAALVADGGKITETSVNIPYFFGTNKRFFDAALELCLKDKTDSTNNFTIYVDENNKLNFEKVGNDSGTLSLSNVLNFELGLKMQDKFNHVVVSCGNDQDDDPVTAYYTDMEGYARLGGRLVAKVLNETIITTLVREHNPGISTADERTMAKEVGKLVAKKYINWYGRIKKILKVDIPDITTKTVNSTITSDLPLTKKTTWIIRKIEIKVDNDNLTSHLELEELIK